MQKKTSLFQHILIFVLAQLAWLSLLGLWIYGYVSNHIIFNRVSEWISPRTIDKPLDVVTFLVGLLLLVAISVGLSLIFRNFNVQLNLTRLYDNFIANVTHELKSPLASIQLYLETLRDRDVPPERQKEFVDSMLQDTNRLYNRINSILDIARLEQKTVAYNFVVHDLETLINRLADEAQSQFRLDDQSLSRHIESTCLVVADESALQIVLDNLIDNALKYRTGPLSIAIDVEVIPQKRACVRVIDQGIGLSGRHQKDVFKKFQRIYGSDIPSVQGTGLGLYWVREIVRVHGGSVSVYSAGTGRGSTFTIEFPVYPVTKKRYINRLLKLTRKISLKKENNSGKPYVESNENIAGRG